MSFDWIGRNTNRATAIMSGDLTRMIVGGSPPTQLPAPS